MPGRFRQVGPGSRGPRTVRSFVRRAGRQTVSQQRALQELWPDFGVGFDESEIDFDTLFGRCAPRWLEIGFGNGESLVQQAADHPEVDFIGIEVHDPGIGHCLLAAEAAQLENLKLIAHDAVEVLQHQVPALSLSRINLYFADPWPKKRHHKRRIVQTAFVEACAEKLAEPGSLHIATDWADYAEHIDAVMGDSKRFVCVERREHDGGNPLDRPATKFERRGIREGHRIWDWRFDKSHL